MLKKTYIILAVLLILAGSIFYGAYALQERKKGNQPAEQSEMEEHKVTVIPYSQLPEDIAKIVKANPESEMIQSLLRKKGYQYEGMQGTDLILKKGGRTYVVKTANEKTSKKDKRDGDFAPFLEGVKYGKHERNTLDFYKAESDQPTPVVIFFHGGGFVGGSRDAIKDKGHAAFLEDCLNAGISVVSADYRLIQDAPFPAAMMDGSRVIQFVKSMAPEWNIYPDKVALSGSSAGANMSIWLAMKGELANVDSKDPLERISTQVKCVVAYSAQTSNDPEFIYEHIYRGSQSHPSTLGFYGISSLDELQTPKIKQKIYEASAINFVTPDAPPVFLDYNGDLTPTPLPEDTDMGIIIHNPKFGEIFKEKMDEAGVECIFHYRSNPTRDGEEVEFLLSHM